MRSFFAALRIDSVSTYARPSIKGEMTIVLGKSVVAREDARSIPEAVADHMGRGTVSNGCNEGRCPRTRPLKA